jgi:hypothetical protein
MDYITDIESRQNALTSSASVRFHPRRSTAVSIVRKPMT